MGGSEGKRGAREEVRDIFSGGGNRARGIFVTVENRDVARPGLPCHGVWCTKTKLVAEQITDLEYKGRVTGTEDRQQENNCGLQ